MKCTEGLKKVALTEKATPFIYAASGTGAMEAVLANVLSPNLKILCIVNGVFGKRWADMASLFGAEVERIILPAGEPVKPEQVKEALDRDKDIKLVLVTFSETSTGVVNPLKEIAEIVKRSQAVLAVDAITGLGAMPLKMDEWGIDIVVSGSQKGFMIPPGLAFVWVGPRAWELHKQSKFPRFYWDWTKAQKALEDKTTAFTPNVSLVCALNETLRLMQNEGIEQTWKRHERLKQCTRRSVEAMGVELLASDQAASAAITAIKKPEGIEIKQIRQKLKQNWQIIVADGQAELLGKIFRIGHLGFVCDRDVLTALMALALTLEDLGFKVNSGWQNVYNQTLKNFA